MVKTSLTHPLRIDPVEVPSTGGLVGMTLCPGKVQEGAVSGPWRRDLGLDLATIRAWGAELLLSLLEPQEYAPVGVQDMADRMPPGLEQVRLPIRDVSVPDGRWEELWAREGPRVRAVLARGGRVCLHCMGGLGRTGLVAARLLVEFGVDPDEAIERVRSARPGAIENKEQEAYVRACRAGAREGGGLPLN